MGVVLLPLLVVVILGVAIALKGFVVLEEVKSGVGLLILEVKLVAAVVLGVLKLNVVVVGFVFELNREFVLGLEYRVGLAAVLNVGFVVVAKVVVVVATRLSSLCL